MGRRDRKVKIRRRLSIREKLRTVPYALKFTIVAAAVAAAAGAGGYAARRYVREQEALVLRVDGIGVRGLPAWLDPEGRRDLEAPPIGVVPAAVSFLDREPLVRLAGYYAQNDWVRRVDSLEYVFPGKTAPGGITCELTLYEPICVVGWESKHEYYFTDAAGRRLGGPLEELPDPELHLPAIVWARDESLPPRGSPWTEERVLHGFAIAELLEKEGLRRGMPRWIARIDVSYVGRRDRSEVLLVTDDRLGLQWGRSPRSELAGRLPVATIDEKLERLRRVLAEGTGEHRGRELNLFEPLEAQGGGIGWLSARPP